MFLTLTLSIFTAAPSPAEEVAPEIPTETSAPAPTETTPAYEPPAEAKNGVGGWAVVDPNTGVVHGVIVCTNDVCGPSGSWAGKLPGEYMGCTNCNLRFQTRATDDGNVAGYSGHSYEIDSSGNASIKNDGSVKWNEKEKNFTIKSSSTDSSKSKVTRTQTLIPEKTASDGKNLHTGIVDINTEYESSNIAGQRVKGSTKQQNFEDKNSAIRIEFPNWSAGKNFTYDNPNLLIENIDSDVDDELNKDGFTTDSNKETSDELVEESEEVIFVKAIKALTENVKSFFSSLFGFSQPQKLAS
jgi:hypothetical protein